MTDIPLKSIPDHRDSGGATLRAKEMAEDPKRTSQPNTENETTCPLKKQKIRKIIATAVRGRKNSVTADKIEMIG